MSINDLFISNMVESTAEKLITLEEFEIEMYRIANGIEEEDPTAEKKKKTAMMKLLDNKLVKKIMEMEKQEKKNFEEIYKEISKEIKKREEKERRLEKERIEKEEMKIKMEALVIKEKAEWEEKTEMQNKKIMKMLKTCKQNRLETLEEYVESILRATKEINLEWKVAIIAATCMYKFKELMNRDQIADEESLKSLARIADLRRKEIEEKKEKTKKRYYGNERNNNENFNKNNLNYVVYDNKEITKYKVKDDRRIEKIIKEKNDERTVGWNKTENKKTNKTEKRQEMNNEYIKEKFKKLCNEETNEGYQGEECKIETIEGKMVKGKPYRNKGSIRQKVKEEIEILCKKGYIRE